VTERGRFLIVLLLAAAGLWLSWLLLLEHHGVSAAAVDALCGEGAASGCAKVSQSPFSSLMGLPLAALGLAFYASLGALVVSGLAADAETARPLAAAAFGLAALALGIDLALLGLQALAIGAYCGLCLLTYAVNAAVLAALWPARTALAAVPRLGGTPAGRLAASGWAVAALLALATGVAADGAVRGRAAAEAQRLLGAPAPEARATPAASPEAGAAAPAESQAPPSPTSDTGSLPDELARARAEARRLQETLDDPNKLQAYIDAKAAREFDEAKPLRVDLSATPTKGPPDAPVKVVEYSDFLCPYCRSLAGAFAGFLPQSQGRVAVYFKHYPLDASCNAKLKQTVHEGACLLALGAVCAQEAGRFWPYHDKVFEKAGEKATRDQVLGFAAEAGLNVASFNECLDRPAARERVAADIEEGARIGVHATPTILVNGKRLPRINDFLRAVDKESQRLGLPPLPQPK
jgi:serine/threonine-protein kinase